MLQAMHDFPPYLHQAFFRALLTAMSQPGEIQRLPVVGTPQPGELVKNLCHTLLDHEVSFACAGEPSTEFSPEDIVQWTHAPMSPPEEADFLFISGSGGHEDILRLKRGTPEMPDLGGTVIYLLKHPLGSEHDGLDLAISGPGVPPPGQRKLLIPGLPLEDTFSIHEANQEFPRGIDCFFLDPEGSVIGLPRSVTINRSM